MEIRTYHPEKSPEVTVMELAGRLDSSSVEDFFCTVEEAADSGSLRLILDCDGLEYISSVGFGIMVRVHSRLQREGGAVRFARLSGATREAFETVGFSKLFEDYPSVEDAVTSLA